MKTPDRSAGPVPGGGAIGARGFTLLELLVVVAILGILAGLLLPALANARAKGDTVVAANNLRQLMLAGLLYADDFADRFPNNFGTDEIRRNVAAGRYLNWVNNVMSWEPDPENTNTFLLSAGGVGPYLSGGVDVFHCPSDRVLSDLQDRAGWTGRTRNVSMNAMVGNAGEFSTAGFNQNNPYYTQFFMVTEVPDPSLIFVFIEEHPDSINDGYFLNRFKELEWYDLPASHHNGGCNLAFADGHVELRQWKAASTKPPARPDAARLPFAIDPADRVDYDWLKLHTTVKKSSYRDGD